MKLTVTCHDALHLHYHGSWYCCGNKAPGACLRWQSGGGGTLEPYPLHTPSSNHTGGTLLKGDRAIRESGGAGTLSGSHTLQGEKPGS